MASKAITYMTNKDQGVELAKRIANWLCTLDGVKLARPTMVTIGNRAYFGARYTKTMTPLSGAKNQESYERDSIYLVGRLAGTKDHGRLGYQPRKKFAYICNGESFGVGYGITEQNIDLQNAQFHPFGVWFDLTPYPIKILSYDNGVPYDAKVIRISEFINY